MPSSRYGSILAIRELYVGFSQSAIDRPVKLLRDFKKVSLEPGETRVVELEVDASDLAWYDTRTKSWEVEKMTYELYVGSSSDTRELMQTTFMVE